MTAALSFLQPSHFGSEVRTMLPDLLQSATHRDGAPRPRMSKRASAVRAKVSTLLCIQHQCM